MRLWLRARANFVPRSDREAAGRPSRRYARMSQESFEEYIARGSACVFTLRAPSEHEGGRRCRHSR
eukprot:2270311-Alexandrium_andersonii.AAC.1